VKKSTRMKKWQCNMCGYVYDQVIGEPLHGSAPGPAWEDVPEDFFCPECRAWKADFEMVEN
jgi:rubredoxin